jgi:MFS family permease
MPTYLIATVAFIGATLGCVFAPSAEVLVLFRALQGAGGEQPGLKDSDYKLRLRVQGLARVGMQGSGYRV